MLILYSENYEKWHFMPSGGRGVRGGWTGGIYELQFEAYWCYTKIRTNIV